MGAARVMRDATWVEREYGQEKWPAVERLLDAALETEGGDFGRTVGRVSREERRSTGPLTPHDGVVGGKAVTAPLAALVGGYQQLVVDAVADACTPKTDLVVELGAGWGRNLCLLWLAGGARSARYVAAEVTESGRRVAERLAELEPRLDLRAVAFDYRKPKLTGLPAAEDAVVFSAHSIEQVGDLPAAAIDAIRGLARNVRCLHFEPVGWQLGRTDLIGSAEHHADRHDYNRNLVRLLQAQERAGVLRIEHVIAEAIGINPNNSTSVITWSSRTGA